MQQANGHWVHCSRGGRYDVERSGALVREAWAMWWSPTEATRCQPLRSPTPLPDPPIPWFAELCLVAGLAKVCNLQFRDAKNQSIYNPGLDCTPTSVASQAYADASTVEVMFTAVLITSGSTVQMRKGPARLHAQRSQSALHQMRSTNSLSCFEKPPIHTHT
jgi:uncharacterized membrane protein